MKVLVTGGAGFIGSYLIKYWLATDKSVCIMNVDKLTYCGDLSRLKSVERHPRYHFLKGDICSREIVEHAMEGCDAVIHLAAETHVDRSLINAKVFYDTNILGTQVLLDTAKAKGIKKFLLVSTDEVYGSCLKGFFKETDVLGPTSPYSVSKTAADLLTLAYAHSHRMHTMVTRGSNTFGPYQYPEKIIPLFVSRALRDEPVPLYGDGRQVRNWIYVEDHCRGILHVLKKGLPGHAYNIATRDSLMNIVLTKKILTYLNKPLTLIKKVDDRVGHDRRYAISSTKIRNLGWKEKFAFDESIEFTLDWYKKNRDWWEKINEKNEEFRQYLEKAYKGQV